MSPKCEPAASTYAGPPKPVREQAPPALTAYLDGTYAAGVDPLVARASALESIRVRFGYRAPDTAPRRNATLADSCRHATTALQVWRRAWDS